MQQPRTISRPGSSAMKNSLVQTQPLTRSMDLSNKRPNGRLPSLRKRKVKVPRAENYLYRGLDGSRIERDQASGGNSMSSTRRVEYRYPGDQYFYKHRVGYTGGNALYYPPAGNRGIEFEMPSAALSATCPNPIVVTHRTSVRNFNKISGERCHRGMIRNILGGFYTS